MIHATTKQLKWDKQSDGTYLGHAEASELGFAVGQWPMTITIEGVHKTSVFQLILPAMHCNEKIMKTMDVYTYRDDAGNRVRVFND
jgi:hypothetical protein